VRIVPRSLALGAAAVLLAACGGSVPADAAATVNGEEIPRSQVEDAVDDLAEQLAEVPDDQRAEAEEAQQREILTLLIQAQIIDEVVDDAGVEVDQATQDEIREDIVASIPGGEDGLSEALAQAGLTEQLFEEVFVPQQARVIALSESLAEGETLETRTVRHILVESEEAGDEAVDRLEEGEDFGELAEELSTDEGSAAQGGELPPSPRGAFVPEFDEATWDAELNEVVGPIESQFGFHVLEVLEEDTTEASDLEPQQVQELVGPELEELILGAFADAEVEVDEAFGEWDPDQQAVVPEGMVGEAPEMPMDPGAPSPEGELSPEELEELERQLEEMEQMEDPEGEAPQDAPEGDDAGDAGDTDADDTDG
jgi:parvulin-like peptidyl-prolyl isomerase